MQSVSTALILLLCFVFQVVSFEVVVFSLDEEGRQSYGYIVEIDENEKEGSNSDKIDKGSFRRFEDSTLIDFEVVLKSASLYPSLHFVKIVQYLNFLKHSLCIIDPLTHPPQIISA